MRRLVAVVMASLCTVLIGGEAPATPIGGEAPATPIGGEAPATRPGFDLAATVARFEALHISIAGTAAEHRASELLNYHRIEVGIAGCMRAHRRPYRKPPFVSFYRDFVDADFGIGNGGARIIDSLTASTRRWELNVIGGARLARAGADDRKVRPADVGVLNGCAKPFEYRGYPDFDPPAGTYWLSGFHDLMEPIDRDATVVKAWHGYDDCMTGRHGYVVGVDRSDFLFGPTFKLKDPPVDGAPAGPAWHRAVAESKAVFAADAECRRPAYVAAMRLVADGLDAWQARHRAELLTIRRAWHQREVAAARIPR